MSFTLNQVTFRYPGALAGRVSLQDVSTELPGGEVVAVLGPSGCGKTTLLNLLALLWEGPMEPGKILYQNGAQTFDYHDLNRDAELRARLRREQFGVILQNCYLLAHFTCLQNVCLPLALQGWDEPLQTAWAKALIKRADARRDDRQADAENDLWDVRDKAPREVSLGQKQRMAVLRAVAHNPRVVFADEPISNLDRSSMHSILQMLIDWQRGLLLRESAKELLDSPASFPPAARRLLESWQEPGAHGRTLFLVCHHLETAKACADRALLFDENHRLVGAFTPDAAAQWPELDARLGEVFPPNPIRKPPQ